MRTSTSNSTGVKICSCMSIRRSVVDVNMKDHISTTEMNIMRVLVFVVGFILIWAMVNTRIDSAFAFAKSELVLH